MNNKSLKKFLTKNGFKDIGGDGRGDMYEHKYNDMTFWVSRNGKNYISFCYSSDGWYQIENPSIQQIEFALDFFESTVLLKTKDFKKQKHFNTTILSVLKDFLNKKIL